MRCGTTFGAVQCGAVRDGLTEYTCGAVRCGADTGDVSAVRCGSRNEACGAVRLRGPNICPRRALMYICFIY